MKEYRQKNKEKIVKKNKEYWQKNKEKIDERKKEYIKEYYEKNKEKLKEHSKEYRENNKEKYKEYNKEYYENNKEKYKEYTRNYRKNNKECRKKSKEYREKNKEKLKEYSKEYRENNINAIIAGNMRSRVRLALKSNQKSGHTLELLGCSIDHLKKHIEDQFTIGMNWDNYGLYGWHIDHIKPCSMFNLELESEQRLCFHWSNLQPLWAEENLSKNNRYIG
jgi:hypothetical protein